MLALVDLGTMGTTHRVSEPDMLGQIRKGIGKISVDRMRRRAQKAIEASKTVPAGIPACVEEKHIAKEYLYTFTHDIKGYDGTILYQAGQTVPVNTKMKKSLCIVDGRNARQLKASIESVTQEGACDKTMIAGGDVDLIAGEQRLGGTYPFMPLLSEAVYAPCYPVRIELEGTEIRYDTYRSMP